MAGWLEILVAAFVLQLSVLPGEKVQFMIAGLSTRYSPWIVVSAAGTAFAGWTAVEILVGSALRDVLATVYLDAITAVLFLLFAVLLVRSAPEPGQRHVPEPGDREAGAKSGPEVTVLGRDVPPYLRGFLPIFVLMAVGEVGDKTQLVTIGLAVQYGAHPAIWAGEMLAIIPVSTATALFFHRFSHRFDLRLAHLAGAALFAFFGLDTVLGIVTGFSIWGTVVGAISSAVGSLV